MKTARLLKTEGQVTISVKLARGGQINESVTVQFEPQPKDEALERYRPLAKMVMDTGAGMTPIMAVNTAGVWKTKCKKAEKLLRAVMQHIAPIVEHAENTLGPKPPGEHPVLADIRALFTKKASW